MLYVISPFKVIYSNIYILFKKKVTHNILIYRQVQIIGAVT